VKLEITKVDLANMVQGLGEPWNTDEHPLYRKNGRWCEEYGLVTFWAWRDKWWEPYTEEELRDAYFELRDFM